MQISGKRQITEGGSSKYTGSQVESPIGQRSREQSYLGRVGVREEFRDVKGSQMCKLLSATVRTLAFTPSKMGGQINCGSAISLVGTYQR